MALAELSMLEQRYLAIREVLDTGATVTDVAARHGVERRTLHRWLVRYASDEIGALAEKSSKPDRCPHQLSAVIEARVVSMRTAHPFRVPGLPALTSAKASHRSGHLSREGRL